jgi:hypothetical protein
VINILRPRPEPYASAFSQVPQPAAAQPMLPAVQDIPVFSAKVPR